MIALNQCSDAGPLGASVVHPGPIQSYAWNTYILPAWLVEMVHAEDLTVHQPLAQALLVSIRETAVPLRYDFDRMDWS